MVDDAQEGTETLDGLPPSTTQYVDPDIKRVEAEKSAPGGRLQ
jgi:hypothetical protein